MANGATMVAGIATDASTMTTTTIAAGMVTVAAVATGGASGDTLSAGGRARTRSLAGDSRSTARRRPRYLPPATSMKAPVV